MGQPRPPHSPPRRVPALTPRPALAGLIEYNVDCFKKALQEVFNPGRAAARRAAAARGGGGGGGGGLRTDEVAVEEDA